MLKRLFALVLAALVVAAFASCSGSSSTKATGKIAAGCTINSDCDSPLVCAFQRCHNECVSSRDCTMGQRCVASDRPFKVCQLDEERACSTNAECPLGMLCGVDGQCRDQCATNRDCISGQTCVSGTCADTAELVDGSLPPSKASSDGGTVTTGPCVYSSDCPEPLVCRGGGCVAECRQDRDCDYFASCIEGRCRLGGSGFPGAGGGSNGGGGASGNGGRDPSAGGETGTGAGPGGGGTSGAGGTTGTGGGGGTPIDLLDCKSRNTAGATVADKDIATDQTWSGVVHVTQTVLVSSGATLTIEPGTTIIVDTGRLIDVGWNSNAATLIATGTATQPISFCGSAATGGNWTGLLLEQNVTSSSILQNVLIADAGGTNAGLELRTAVTLNNVQVRNSGADGVWATNFRAGSTALSVDGAVGAAVSLRGEGAVARFPLGGVLTGNGTDVARVDFTTIDADTPFHDLGIPYLQTGDLIVTGAAVATFEAGVEYRFGASKDLEVGWNSGGSTLVVDGTAARPVTFRGETPEAGNWGGLLVDATVTARSHIAHAKILHGGGGEPALKILTPITLNDVALDLNATGVSITAEGLNSDSTMLSVTRTSGVPLTVAPGALTTIPTGGSFTGNTTDQVFVQSGYYDRSGVVPDLAIPYYLDGEIDLRNNAVLEIAPGNDFIVNAGVLIDVGWNSTPATFIAKGTAAAPITFRGLDTTNGYWNGIVVRATALSASAIDHVSMKNAGKANSGGLALYKEVPVTNSSFSNSAGYGIYYNKTFTTNYAATNTFSSDTQGNVGTF